MNFDDLFNLFNPSSNNTISFSDAKLIINLLNINLNKIIFTSDDEQGVSIDRLYTIVSSNITRKKSCIITTHYTYDELLSIIKNNINADPKILIKMVYSEDDILSNKLEFNKLIIFLNKIF